MSVTDRSCSPRHSVSVSPTPSDRSGSGLLSVECATDQSLGIGLSRSDREPAWCTLWVNALTESWVRPRVIQRSSRLASARHPTTSAMIDVPTVSRVRDDLEHEKAEDRQGY